MTTINIKQTADKITFKNDRRTEAVITHVHCDNIIWRGDDQYRVPEYYDVYMPMGRGHGVRAKYMISEWCDMIKRTCDYCAGIGETVYKGLAAIRPF